MKKRRLPSLRRQGPEADPPGVVFEDLPPDERSSEVVMHPSPGGEGTTDDPDDTKPRPTMPASAVIVHDAPEFDAEPERPAVDDDYVFRPPADAEPEDAGDDDEGFGDLEPAVPDVVVDADVRAEVVESTAVSTFVEGPPGSGISTLLVDRIVASLRSGGPAAGSVAVVTRDAGAAALFSDRLRDALESAAQDESDEVVRRRLGAAVGRLRSTPIGPGAVIAEAILRRWPEAAGVAPGFEVVAGPLARLDFEAGFRAWLAGPGGEEPAVVRALARGVTPMQVHDVAEALTRHVGLTPSRSDDGPARRDPPEPDPAWLLEDSRRRIDELVELAGHGTDGDDGVAQISALQRWLGDASGLEDEDVAGHFLANAPAKVRAAGSRANWDPPETCATQMERCRELGAIWADARRALGRSTITDLVSSLADLVEEERLGRLRGGRLYPTDVVPAALDLLAADAAVRRIERDRHGVLFVDDVWDVDAPTLALVLILSSLGDDVEEPFSLRPGPGRLVCGGASVTATHRSLGADPRLVARLRDRAMTPLGLRTVFRQSPALVGWTTAACRALLSDDSDVQVEAMAATPAPAPVVETPDVAVVDEDASTGADEANAGEEVSEEREEGSEASHAGDAGRSDEVGADPNSSVSTNEIPLPARKTVLTPEGHMMEVPLAEGSAAEAASGLEGADRAEIEVAHPPPPPSEWGAVVAAWCEADCGDPGAQRAAEARAVAAAMRDLVDSAEPCVREPAGGSRPAHWSDCALVLGSGAGLETYLDALEAAGIPFSRPSTGAELLRRQEVQDLLAVLRAADDAGDVIATIGALRGLAFGCTDTDLVTAVAVGGALAATATPAEGTPEHVAAGLQVLARLGESRDVPALDLVDLALELTDYEEAVAGATGADPASVEAVRALAAEWGGRKATVRTFLDCAEAVLRPLGPPPLVTRPVRPEAVEVLTVAEARGREFPVVAVANMHRLRVPLPVAVADHSAGRLHVRAGRADRGLVTEGFDAALARDDEEYLAQRTRLVCAAFSRARDKLLIAFAASPEQLDPEAEVPSRELVQRVARLLAEPDPEAPLGIRAKEGVTLVPVAAHGARSSVADTDAVEGPGEPVAEPPVEAPGQLRRSVSTLGKAPEDPLRAALALAVSRADFDTAPVATAPVPAEAISAACHEVGADGAEAEVAALLENLMGTDLWARADDAERVLRRPTVYLDGGAEGAFSDRLDLALVEDGTVTGIALTLTGVDGRLGTRVALATHALALAAGVPVGAAVIYDARTGEATEMGSAEVAAAVGSELS